MKEPGRGYARYVLALLILVGIAGAMGRQVLETLLDLSMREDLGLGTGLEDAGLFSLSFAGIAFVTVLSGLVTGRWADRSGRKTVLVIMLPIFCLATAACSLAAGLATLGPALLVAGIAWGAVAPASHALLAEHYPLQRRATAFALLALAVPIGTAVAPALSMLGNEILGWRVTLMLAVIPGLIVAVLLMPTLREPRPASQDVTPPVSSVVRHLWQRRAFRHLCAACALLAIAYSASTFDALLSNRAGLTATQIGLTYASSSFGAFLAGILGGVLADRISRRRKDERWYFRLPALVIAVGVLAQIFGYFSTGLTLLAAMHFIAGLASTVYLAPVYAVTQALATSRMRSVAASVVIFINTAPAVLGVGAVLVGLLSDYVDLRVAILLKPALNAWAAVHFLIGARHLPKDLVEPNLVQPALATPAVNLAV